MLGRPALLCPVCRKSTPVEWIGRSAFIERMTASSSAQVARCGNNSLTGMPQRPAGANFHGLLSHLRLALAVGLSILPASLPSISASFGLGSNESTCETPPSMKQKMTFLARGRKCCFAPRLLAAGAPATPYSLASADSASQPNPLALARNISRRDHGQGARPGQQGLSVL